MNSRTLHALDLDPVDRSCAPKMQHDLLEMPRFKSRPLVLREDRRKHLFSRIPHTVAVRPAGGDHQRLDLRLVVFRDEPCEFGYYVRFGDLARHVQLNPEPQLSETLAGLLWLRRHIRDEPGITIRRLALGHDRREHVWKAALRYLD